MQKLFRKSSISLFNSGKIDKDTMHNYYMSGTRKKIKKIITIQIIITLTMCKTIYYSDRERSHKWYIKSEKYKKSLFGLRPLHKQYQSPKFEKSFQLFGHSKQKY